jgi:hypothetical protein
MVNEPCPSGLAPLPRDRDEAFQTLLEENQALRQQIVYEREHAGRYIRGLEMRHKSLKENTGNSVATLSVLVKQRGAACERMAELVAQAEDEKIVIEAAWQQRLEAANKQIWDLQRERDALSTLASAATSPAGSRTPPPQRHTMRLDPKAAKETESLSASMYMPATSGQASGQDRVAAIAFLLEREKTAHAEAMQALQRTRAQLVETEEARAVLAARLSACVHCSGQL